MHTNNPWPGKCTEEPLTKPGNRELNPLCVTILPTSATLSELLFKYICILTPSPLIHVEIIIKVQTVAQSSLTTMTQAKHQTVLWYCLYRQRKYIITG